MKTPLILFRVEFCCCSWTSTGTEAVVADVPVVVVELRDNVCVSCTGTADCFAAVKPLAVFGTLDIVVEYVWLLISDVLELEELNS